MNLVDMITQQGATDYFQVRRWRATAATWFQKTATSLRWQHGQTTSDSTRSLLAEETARLLVSVLGDAYHLIPLLREDMAFYTIKDVEREAQALITALRNLRLAAKLADTTGRTPEEAEAFRRKAAQLSGKDTQ